MKVIGYHRTLTIDQHLDQGIKEIKEYCKSNNLSLKKLYTDQQTGKNFNRPRYIVMKKKTPTLHRGTQILFIEFLYTSIIDS